MLRLKCKNCGGVLLEAEERWEQIARTGMCPECSWFYDDRREVEVQRIAGSPEVVANARAIKVRELLVGSLYIVVALAAFGFFILMAKATGVIFKIAAVPLLILLVYGLRLLIHGLLYSATRQARSQLARPQNLATLAKRQEDSGVFMDR